MKYVTFSLVAVAAVLTVSLGHAQQYPDRPIEMVVPFAPGGGSDIFCRNFVKYIQEEKILPVTFNITNKPGGSGVVGYSYVAARKGDPYIITTTSGSFFTTPLVSKSPVNYRDFTPVAGMGTETFILVTLTKRPYHNLQDLIAAAKKDPGKITIGLPGVATDDRVVTQLFQRSAGIKFNDIVFGGSGPMLIAALGGHVDLIWANIPEIMTHIEAKKVRPLAVSYSKRVAVLPDVPTLKELGHDVDHGQYRGIVMPKDIPAEAFRVISDAINKLCRNKRWQTEYMEKYVIIGDCLNAQEFRKLMDARNDSYKKVFTEFGLIK